MPPSPSKTIRVMVRIRPPNRNETNAGERCDVLTVDRSEKLVTVEGISETFTFHHIFNQNSEQSTVFDIYAKDAVERALEGYHGILFAYGQTGSGKTHTMSCTTAGEEGVLQRCLQTIWDRKASDAENQYSIEISYVELYNEAFTDLLCDHGEDPGLTMHQVDEVTLTRSNGKEIGRPAATIKEAMGYFDLGATRKSTAETAMNDRSSRSHTIFTVYITKQPRNGGECVHGRLILCDLAGSERQKKTQVQGKQLDEAKFINKSLMQLGIVVKQMAKREVPSFRNSKLTQLLRYSLSGKGCTSIMVTVSPAEYNKSESLGSMRFGQCAITIKQEPEKHVDVDYKTMCEKLKRQMAELEQRLMTRDEGAIDMLREEYERRISELHEDYGAQISDLQRELAAAHMERSANAQSGLGSPLVMVDQGPAENQQQEQQQPAFAGGVAVPVPGHTYVIDGVEHRPYEAYLALRKIRDRLREKETLFQQSQQQLITVTHERDTERQKVWDLAVILRQERKENAKKEAMLQDRIDKLKVLAQTAEGTELTSTEVTQEDEQLVDAMTAALAKDDVDGTSPRGDFSKLQWFEDELARTRRCLSVLRDQRIALRTQLDKAKRSIRMLTLNPELSVHSRNPSDISNYVPEK
eukprot:PhM_4_TR2723/c0_g1_i1/m.105111/K10396/KIF5; kinesin family member 5